MANIFISPELVDGYKKQLSVTASSATTKRKMSSLNKFFDWAEKQGHITENPLKKEGTTTVNIHPQKAKKYNLGDIIRPLAITTLAISVIILVSRLKVPFEFIFTPAADPQQTSQTTPTSSPIATSSATAFQETDPLFSKIYKDGVLILEGFAPSLKAIGSLLIESGNIVISTEDNSDGDISLNPDGSGNLNMIFEGTNGNQVVAQSANLNSGSLYYGYIGNNSPNPYLIKLESGSTPQTKFSVDSTGHTTINGSLNLSGDIQFSGLARITQEGEIEFVSGYYQNSGNFEIDQGPSDFANITKYLDFYEGPGKSDSVTFNFTESGNIGSNYDTLVLKRSGGTNDSMALFVDEGNAKFDGQVQLGRFSSNPAAIGQGSLIFNTTDLATYVWNGSSWNQVGGSGDITSVTAGSGLSGGGTSGDVTLDINLDTTAAVRGVLEIW